MGGIPSGEAARNLGLPAAAENFGSGLGLPAAARNLGLPDVAHKAMLSSFAWAFAFLASVCVFSYCFSGSSKA
jgi:hypothetical protein